MSEGPDRLVERVDALEMRLAYQDETIEQLNKTITEQWRSIDALQRKLAALAERLEDAVSGPAPVDRPPPHY